ncbi:MAG: XRE family transcriptional regulator [Verrucomicrobiae bacterium]|nr:XRE family transcriptional regulator [Verrucomicrobiae bacterium]
MNPSANDLIEVGLRIRDERKNRQLTLETLAKRTDLSKGLLSKIENFRTIPSLPVLASIAQALNVDMGKLVSGIGGSTPAPYTLIKAAERKTIERDQAVGFLYQALGAKQINASVFEAFVLTLSPQSRRKRVSTEGDQFIFIIQGEVDFHLGQECLRLTAGDALFFDGRVPHVPKNPGNTDAILLAVYLLQN